MTPKSLQSRLKIAKNAKFGSTDTKEGIDGSWHGHREPIGGFFYEPGNAYELRVQKEYIRDPLCMDDCPTYRWTLLEEISKNVEASPNGDNDFDHVSDAIEDRNGDGNPTNDDTDGDGIPDFLDRDDDGDDIPTWRWDPFGTYPLEILPDGTLAPRNTEDRNGDGDPTNDDTDGDTVPNYLDADDETEMVYVSSSTGGQVNGISFRDEDIMMFNPTTGSWIKYFDGSDVGISRVDLNAFHIMANDEILISFNRPINIGGLAIDDSDIVRFSATALGEQTAGTFSLYLDGSDVGLTRKGEDIDAIGMTPDGRLVVSTLGAFRVPNLRGRDEDLIVLDGAALGENSSGVWSLYFDGSDIDLLTRDEDVWATWIDPSTGALHLSTRGQFDVPVNISGDGADIFTCSAIVLGPDTSCSINFGWDGDAHGFGGERIDGYAIGQQSQTTLLLLVDDISAANVSHQATSEVDDTLDDDVHIDDEALMANQVFLPFVVR